MEVSKINNTQNFNARLCGDFRQVIAISQDGGMPGKAVQKLLNEVQKVLPNKKDRVFFIFRKPTYEDYWGNFQIRSQVEILKEGDTFNRQGLRANVYPFKSEPKMLLENFVETIKKLANGEIGNQRKRHFYPEKGKNWIEKYRHTLKEGWVNFDEGIEKAASKSL